MIFTKGIMTLFTAISFIIGYLDADRQDNGGQYYYHNEEDSCLPVTVNKRCVQPGYGCLGTQGESLGRQLYIDSCCLNPIKE